MSNMPKDPFDMIFNSHNPMWQPPRLPALRPHNTLPVDMYVIGDDLYIDVAVVGKSKSDVKVTASIVDGAQTIKIIADDTGKPAESTEQEETTTDTPETPAETPEESVEEKEETSETQWIQRKIKRNFTVSIEVSNDYDVKKASSTCTNGLLTVKVPMNEAVKPQEIVID